MTDHLLPISSNTLKEKYLNRELSWLAFNERVLQEAANKNVPLVDRMKFLGIFSNNLDEFFRVRVATIRRMAVLEKKNKKLLTASGFNSGAPNQIILKQIQHKVVSLQKEFNKIYKQIQKELEAHRIFIIDEKKILKVHEPFLNNYFKNRIQPHLVPILLDHHTPTPSLKDKSIYLFVKFLTKRSKQRQFSLIEIPTDTLSRFLELPGHNKKKFIIYLEDIIRLYLPAIFQLFEPSHFESYIIKQTRDAELNLENDLSDSFFEQIQKSLEHRKKGDPVRFTYDESMPAAYLNVLLKKLKLTDTENIIPGGRYHNFKDFMNFPNVGGSELEYPPARRVTYPPFERSASLIHAISQRDHLLFFPYHPFEYVVHLLREAAISPAVKSIKITLYRLARNSMIINALINAARNGKKVTAVLELQARFDEEANLNWSKKLTDEGVHLIFGVTGIKTHAKLISISWTEKNKDRHLAFIGTGNFNESTAKVYTDIALLTADQGLSREVERVFHHIEKPYIHHTFKHLLVSPAGMRKKLLKLIDQEVRMAQRGKPAYIRVKLNNLVDNSIIDALYLAGKAGVKIQLFVRGVCSLIPGEKGLSENISAVSIIDRYLEHSRLFVFCNGGDPLYYLSSADWMMRNLDYRIEVAAPVYDKSLKKEIDHYLNIVFSDNQKMREHNLSMDNRFITSDKKQVRSQEEFLEYLKSKPDTIEVS